MNYTFFLQRKFLVTFLIVILLAVAVYFFTRSPQVDFNTSIKPILNAKCISCHGGVKAKAGFSVLFREEAMAPTASGKPAIIPGDPDASELIRRISHKDPDERMPYKHEPLTEEEINLFRLWVKQGAKWGDHWAYVPVEKTNVPKRDSAWGYNDIDNFILEKLREKKLSPSPEADKATLLRRVSLDLIGTYPEDDIAYRFLKDTSANAYEVLVDSLLSSDRYGEKWAAMWLDIARYADTKGYESDYNRTIWKYRDWVIKSFNEDKPYSEFITEQMAGDLLPGASEDQYVATAFHRNSMNNDEGGTDNEEFRLSEVMDRVNTTWQGLMSTTFSCVQCHSHPYDPIRHDEYYKFLAYFNNTRDEDVPEELPILRHFPDSVLNQLNTVTEWVKKNGTAVQADKTLQFLKTWQPALYFHNADSINEQSAVNNNAIVIRKDAVFAFYKVDMEGIARMMLEVEPRLESKGEMTVYLDSVNGKVLGKFTVMREKKKKKKKDEEPAQAFQFGALINKYNLLEFESLKGFHDIYFEYKNPSLKDKKEDAGYFYWMGFMPEFPGKTSPSFEAMKYSFDSLLNANVETTPVLIENPENYKRSTHVFERGNWRTKGKVVEPAIPALFAAYVKDETFTPDRIGLSKWLTHSKNPLVSRTLVNRLWEQVFGAGIVETLEDMGTQGMLPTHRELLDHLSWKFVHEYNWSIKKLLKEIVMSATYRQDSKVSEDVKNKDAFNKYFARAPRIRLSAEQLRDQGLHISGQLSKKMYGPSVMPWQPDGIWLFAYNGATWQTSTGEDQHRRALYTFMKRSTPYPAMFTFDGTSRETCTARRIRTNTPLQALVTLNDSAFLNMARQLAKRMHEAAPSNIEQQVKKGYEIMLYKQITPYLQKVFTDLYTTSLTAFKTDPEKTCEMWGIQDEFNNPEFAALIVVANAMLNLDEVITKN
jgi:hypothetical protein